MVRAFILTKKGKGLNDVTLPPSPLQIDLNPVPESYRPTPQYEEVRLSSHPLATLYPFVTYRKASPITRTMLCSDPPHDLQNSLSKKRKLDDQSRTSQKFKTKEDRQEEEGAKESNQYNHGHLVPVTLAGHGSDSQSRPWCIHANHERRFQPGAILRVTKEAPRTSPRRLPQRL